MILPDTRSIMHKLFVSPGELYGEERRKIFLHQLQSPRTTSFPAPRWQSGSPLSSSKTTLVILKRFYQQKLQSLVISPTTAPVQNLAKLSAAHIINGSPARLCSSECDSNHHQPAITTCQTAFKSTAHKALHPQPVRKGRTQRTMHFLRKKFKNSEN